MAIDSINGTDKGVGVFYAPNNLSTINYNNIDTISDSDIGLAARIYNRGTDAVGEAMSSHTDSNAVSAIVQMDSTHYVVVYKTSSALKAIAYSLSGSTLTPGTAVTITTDAVSEMHAASMSSTHLIATYYSSTNTQREVTALSLSGTTLTVGSSAVVDTNVSAGGSICSMSSTRAIVTYNDSTDDEIEAACISLSGTVPTVTTPVQVQAYAFGNQTAVTSFDSTYALVSYRGNGGMLANCLSLSDTTITVNTGITFPLNPLGSSTTVSASAFSSTEAIVVFGARVFGSDMLLVTRSGTSISAGSLYKLSQINVNTNPSSIAVLSPTLFVAGYSIGGDGRDSCIPIVKSGSTLTAGKAIILTALNFNGAVVWSRGTRSAVVESGTSSIVVTFCDGADSSKLTTTTFDVTTA
jgi:hypothetical protein